MTRQDVEKAIDAATLAEVRRLYGVLIAALAAQEERGGEERFFNGVALAVRAQAIANDAAGRLIGDT